MQYQAVLYIDLDTLIVRPFSGVFREHLPAMVAKGLTLGMGSNSFPYRRDFNAGVILLLPDQGEFVSLVAGKGSIPHDVELAKQAYLNLNPYFARRIYRLPFAYNSMVSMRPAVPTPWRDSEAIIIHYTCQCKPWHPYNCWTTDFNKSKACQLSGPASEPVQPQILIFSRRAIPCFHFSHQLQLLLVPELAT